MHGNTRSVERRIRLWIVQQERSRRKQGQPGRTGVRENQSGEQRQPAVNVRKREQWQ
jgi:hypothetical protein